MAVNNVEKLITYISCVSKDNIEVNGKDYTQKIETIMLSPTFFHTDDCYSCGNCCTITEHNVYTQSEYDRIMSITEAEFNQTYSNLDYTNILKLRGNIVEDMCSINGKDIPLYIYHHIPNIQFLENKSVKPERDTCSWMHNYNGKYYCDIHPVRSITCKMPHLRFFYNKNVHKTSMGTSQYGRNWALGCTIKFHEPDTEIQFQTIKSARIEKLQHLQRCAEDLHIETYLPRIIDYIYNIPFDNFMTYLEKDMIHQHKSILK